MFPHSPRTGLSPLDLEEPSQSQPTGLGVGLGFSFRITSAVTGLLPEEPEGKWPVSGWDVPKSSRVRQCQGSERGSLVVRALTPWVS